MLWLLIGGALLIVVTLAVVFLAGAEAVLADHHDAMMAPEVPKITGFHPGATDTTATLDVQ